MSEHIGSRGMAYALELVKRCDEIALNYNIGATCDAWQGERDLVEYIGRNDPMPSLGALVNAITDGIEELRAGCDYGKITAVQVLKVVADKTHTHRLHEALMEALDLGGG